MNLTAFAAAVLPVLVSASTAVANPADTSEAPTLDRQQTIDEVVVFGKYLSSTAAHIDVVSEPVLDAAESLSRLPGADANANGRISGGTGRAVHGFWNKQWENTVPQVGNKLHHNNGSQPFTLSPYSDIV